MDKRVFHIDQECFIVYAEDYSNEKERFLRIGNSPFLGEFGAELTFLTLVTPLYPGNPFYEKDIFLPDRDRKIIGLKKIVEDFFTFLKNEKVDMDKVKILYAEKDGVVEPKITEKEFLEDIKNTKIQKHSFASFYKDGNIRIFNKNEMFFDLNETLESFLNERKEIYKLYSFFFDFYKDFYDASGIVLSGKSLFIFSKNKFSCISDGNEWVKDAIRVGINPIGLDLLYLSERATPDSLWIKTFLGKWEKGIKTKLILKEIEPNWLNLIPKDLSLNVFPHRESVDIHTGKIRLFFQNDRIKIIYNKIKIELITKNNFLDSQSILLGNYVGINDKKDFNLIIDDYKTNHISLFSYAPMIFEDFIDNTSENLESKDIENRKILIKQSLGILNDKIVKKNFIGEEEIIPIPPRINSFSIFQKDFDLKKIKEIYRNFKDEKIKFVNQNNLENINMVGKRFSDIIEMKEFFLEERKALKKAIKYVIEKEKTQENLKKDIKNTISQNKIEKSDEDSKNIYTSENDNYNGGINIF